MSRTYPWKPSLQREGDVGQIRDILILGHLFLGFALALAFQREYLFFSQRSRWLTLATLTRWKPFLFCSLHSPISYFNLASRPPPLGSNHKAATHLISYSMSYTWLLGVVVNFDTKCTNSLVELTLENRFARECCPRTYKHMVKLTLNPYGTLGS